ncbi:MAG: bifunctional diaminohydroxyphosphoribosylaminopyrimidine deaminase/5-amino-6-(5-phosphoribosylamino)uracil reductase RibD [Rhodospirillales bacterium]|nr:bifunctional diaminohydroxyphosphoribosylaminopyrimidine deaminase/5-amino-6-(5-phosphoribosylamino)uracil reductase RibD [Rhodospirillales bacterium]
MSDTDFMRAALALARRGLGQTAPNPSVGCVIVNKGNVVGRGFTAPGGRPHAEVMALRAAGERARGGTAYVTLEPCSFSGKSGPCTDALISAGLSRVVLGAQDPHPKVNGLGVAQLKSAGILVTENVLKEECEAVIAGFAAVQREQRPLLRLKLATSLDGCIATSGRESQWITGPEARLAVHAMRGRHDAVLTGVGTVLDDNPELTCRIEGFRTVPLIRIVVDSHLRTPLLSKLVRGAAEHPLWILHRDGADKLRRRALEDAGAKLFELPGSSAGVDLSAGMQALARAGITRVLAEGGGTLAAGLLRAKLVDRISWFHAPCIIGGDGYSAVQAFGISRLEDAPRFALASAKRLGHDMLSQFRRVE